MNEVPVIIFTLLIFAGGWAVGLATPREIKFVVEVECAQVAKSRLERGAEWLTEKRR